MARKRTASAVSCPNCSEQVKGDPRHACVLEALMSIVLHRGEISAAKVRRLWATADIDQMWAALGPVIDRLEAGEFSSEPGPLTRIAERAEEEDDDD